jgi:hypothetical protein
VASRHGRNAPFLLRPWEGKEREPQFFVLSTSRSEASQGIIALSFAPTFSMG